MDKKKTIIAVSAAAAVFAVAAGVVFLNREPEETVEILPEVTTAEETTIVTTVVPQTELVTEEPVTTYEPFVNGLSLRAQDAKLENSDTVGWIRISNTVIDYPVLQTNDNDYYIDKNFYRNPDRAGWVYMDFRCGISSEYFTDNTLMYGHNMASGVMFSDLKNYERYEWFYGENPIIEVSSLTTDYQYKIFAFMPCNGAHGSDFEFWNYIFFSREKEPEWTVREYLQKIDEKSLVKTNVDIREDDKFLALSTCYGGDTSDPTRFVVLARMVRPGEDALEGTSGSVRRW